MVVVTEIEDRCSPKPFLGGWRSVNRDLEYHDASSQTRARDFAEPRLVSVPSQTLPRPLMRDRSVLAGGLERSVQAAWPFFPDAADSLLEPRSPEQLRRWRAALRIQSWYRAHRSRQPERSQERNLGAGSSSSCLSGQLESADSEDEANVDRSSLSTLDSLPEDEHCSGAASQPEPGEFHIIDKPAAKGVATRSDLALLSNLLARWSAAEESRIRESPRWRTEASRLAARADKLAREVELLRAIEHTRGELARRKAERSRAKFLDALAKPVSLRAAGNQSVSIDTLAAQRAREFRDVYEALTTPEEEAARGEEFAYSVGHRVELLGAVKRLASLHTCSTSTRLESLIDQELYLLASSRVDPERLRHLRSRVRLAFLSLARNALTRHDERVKLSTKTRLCPSCHRLRGLDAFEADHRERISRTCVDCTALRSRRHPELCLEIYERMLGELRRNEAARRDGASSLSFVMGPKAVRYLVNDIWHGRSVFSGCDELDRLRLARLEPRKPWTPWNNLLATRREARMHEVLASDSPGPPAVYDAELVRKLRRMNLQARLYFESMARHSEPGASL